ncbi:hypothetical protein [Streptomyces sp. NPDC050534]|uniref:hypothetical protein n=1 Tax=Streptomyces sp. NPDC050534 TaxID=3365625 RepID=UPI003794B319
MATGAAHSGTGIAVLYRRWANKDKPVLPALAYCRNSRPVGLPDTDTDTGTCAVTASQR